MNLRRVWAVALRQYYLFAGSPVRFASLFVWIVIDMVLWGFITKFLNQVSHPQTGMDFVPLLLGAVLLWDYFNRVMMGVSTPFLEDVWSRNFLNVFASPMRTSEYLGGFVISSIVTSLLAFIVMLLLAVPLFGLSLFSYGVLLIPFLVTLFLFGIALGISATAMLLRLGPSSEWLIWPIPALLSPLAGVFYPIATLPVPLQYVARILPPSYVFENMRAIIAGKAPSWMDLGIAIVLALAYVVLACVVWQKIFRNAVDSGLLARYGAENVT
jgi:ABC-2 type transport system permease protein